MTSNHNIKGKIPVISGLLDVVDQYDGIIFDVWGVMHDGVKAVPEIGDVLEKLQALKKKIAVLSNSPRRTDLTEDRMTSKGIPTQHCGLIYASGEDTYQVFEKQLEYVPSLGNKYYFIGDNHQDCPIQGLSYVQVQGIENADFILCFGPAANSSSTVYTYEKLLKIALDKKMPMVCPNPDLIISVAGKTHICAGAIAEFYKEMGGVVHYHGKPYPSTYERFLGYFEGISRKKLLMIGDSFRTDIRGANEQGFDSIFIQSGIHAADFAAGKTVEELASQFGVSPTYILDHLRWG